MGETSETGMLVGHLGGPVVPHGEPLRYVFGEVSEASECVHWSSHDEVVGLLTMTYARTRNRKIVKVVKVVKIVVGS